MKNYSLVAEPYCAKKRERNSMKYLLIKYLLLLATAATTLIFATGCTTVPRYYLDIETTVNETKEFNNVGKLSSGNADFDRSIAILPTRYPISPKSVVYASDKKFFNEYLDSCLNLHYDRKYLIHSSNTTMRAINDSGLTEDYSSLINEYWNTGILSKTKIEKMSNVLKSRYMLYTEFIDDNAIEVIDVIMAYQLWDSKYSKPIFTSTVSTGALSNSITNGEIPYNILVAANISTFAKEIKDKNGHSVCPDCPTRQEYYRKVQSANSGNIGASIGGGILGVVLLFILLLLL